MVVPVWAVLGVVCTVVLSGPGDVSDTTAGLRDGVWVGVAAAAWVVPAACVVSSPGGEPLVPGSTVERVGVAGGCGVVLKSGDSSSEG